MSSKYEPEFKHKIVKLHLEEGRSLRSIATEYGISKASITNWCNEFNEECEAQSKNDPDTKTEADYMKENRRLLITAGLLLRQDIMRHEKCYYTVKAFDSLSV